MQQPSKTAVSESQLLWEKILPKAETLIKQHGGFLPYAAFMSEDNNIELLTQLGGESMQEILDTLFKGLKAKFKDIKCSAIVYNGNIDTPSGKNRDVIATLLDHRENYSVIAYMPYKLLPDNKIHFEETFVHQGANEVFPPLTSD